MYKIGTQNYKMVGITHFCSIFRKNGKLSYLADRETLDRLKFLLPHFKYLCFMKSIMKYRENTAKGNKLEIPRS